MIQMNVFTKHRVTDVGNFCRFLNTMVIREKMYFRKISLGRII